MRPLPALCLLVSSAAWAQSVVDFERLPRGLSNLDEPSTGTALRCEITPIHPILNFGFRFQAGYVLRVPMSQFFGPRHGWFIVQRITPQDESRKPVYLALRNRLPDIPRTKNTIETGGGYLLGEGRYKVLWKLTDDQGRSCRKEWTIEAKLSRGERDVRVALPRSTVTDLSLRGVPPTPQSADDAAPIDLTVLLHVAPLSPRRTRMGPRDRLTLLATLSTLLTRIPTRSVRLVAFNLDQQKELYRRNTFRPDMLDQLAQAISTLELGTVDYKVLQNRAGHLDLLANLVNQELEAERPADVVLFLGPESRYYEKVPSDELPPPGASAPRFFYLKYRPFAPATVTFPDSITRVVSRMKGRNIVIRTPKDFAKAIAQLER